jgi:hypothetical protein
MFENVRITAHKHAPEEYIATGSAYFLITELEQLHEWTARLPNNFAPKGLPYAVLLDSSRSVEDIDGFYAAVPPPPTIHIVGKPLNPFGRAIFWHEYAHHVWKFLKVEYRQEWQKLYEAIQTTAAFKEAEEYDTLVEETYMAGKQELWARSFCQYLLHCVNDVDALQMLHTKYDPYQWLAEEFELLTPVMERLLANCGIQHSSPSA